MKTSQRRYSAEELKEYLASLEDPSIEDCPEDLEDLENSEDHPSDSNKPIRNTEILCLARFTIFNNIVRQLLQEKRGYIGRDELVELDTWQIELCNPSYKPERKYN
jgi:hypothetical protein